MLVVYDSENNTKAPNSGSYIDLYDPLLKKYSIISTTPIKIKQVEN